jgi:hypothetical protein
VNFLSELGEGKKETKRVKKKKKDPKGICPSIADLPNCCAVSDLSMPPA